MDQANILQNQHIDNLNIENLPETAQIELLNFYEFLVFKYGNRDKITHDERHELLLNIFHDANGKLPNDYQFDREEIHER